jgi:serine phosphatase RsbU (regulator of sigma subunit)
MLLYRQEYRQKLGDVRQELKILVASRVEMIEQMIDTQQAILNSIKENPRLLAPLFKAEAISIGAGEEETFVSPDWQQEALLVGRRMGSNWAYVITTPFEKLISRLEHLDDSPYPISLSLVGKWGKEFGSPLPQDPLIVAMPVADAPFSIRVAVPKVALHDLQKKAYYYRFATLLMLLGVIGGGILYLLTRRIARPLIALSKTMQRVSEGAVHVRYQSDRMGFEINKLGEQFNQTLDALIHHQTIAEKERLARERLASELKIGHEIQLSMLPAELPEFADIDLAAGYLPAQEVSGDFYDVLTLPSGKILLVVADTAGKGIPACLYSLSLRSALRALMAKGDGLADGVQSANALFLLDARDSGVFSTAWIGLFDPATNELSYCSQGHYPAFLRRAQSVQPLKTGGAAFGLEAHGAIEIASVNLLPNDLLFLYTDGVIEAHNPVQELFGTDRLQELLIRSGHSSSQQLVEQCFAEIKQFCAGAPQHDDITFIAFQRCS